MTDTERVARAIAEHWDVDSTGRHQRVSADWMGEAAAVIFALAEAGLVIVPREPSEAMIAAGCSGPKMKTVNGALQFQQIHGAKFSWGKAWDNSPMYEAWQAMIAAHTEETRLD